MQVVWILESDSSLYREGATALGVYPSRNAARGDFAALAARMFGTYLDFGAAPADDVARPCIADQRIDQETGAITLTGQGLSGPTLTLRPVVLGAGLQDPIEVPADGQSAYADLITHLFTVPDTAHAS